MQRLFAPVARDNVSRNEWIDSRRMRDEPCFLERRTCARLMVAANFDEEKYPKINFHRPVTASRMSNLLVGNITMIP